MTLGSLLVALLIPSGMAVWWGGHRDSCSRFLAGDKSRPPTQMVAVGSQMMEVPCEQWLPRQPAAVQMWWLMEGLAVMVFAIHAVGDVRDRLRARRLRGGVSGDALE